MNQIAMNDAMSIGIIGAGAAIYTIFLVAIAVMVVVALWKIFEKSGEQGWKSLIPVYSSYLIYKIAWDRRAFWITMLLGLLSSVLMGIPMIGPALGVIGALLAGLLEVVCTVKLAKAFEHGGWFALGLILLSPIFILILAFDKSEYIGPQQ